jgi:hypothetical protein
VLRIGLLQRRRVVRRQPALPLRQQRRLHRQPDLRLGRADHAWHAVRRNLLRRFVAPLPAVKFNQDYFDRYYVEESTRVRGPGEIEHLMRGMTGFIDWVESPLKSALDAGAGTGEVRDWLRANRPEISLRSVDVSEYACEKYGHERADLSRFRDGSYDLIVCIDVIRYLSDADCAAALENLAAMCSRFLYLQVMTVEDRLRLDPRSDLETEWRPRSFYTQLLEPHFEKLGLGLWVRRGAPIVFWSMER